MYRERLTDGAEAGMCGVIFFTMVSTKAGDTPVLSIQLFLGQTLWQQTTCLAFRIAALFAAASGTLMASDAASSTCVAATRSATLTAATTGGH
ncbi:MAG: hypothetical protein FRX49_03302 [Trebouxia sp. A1-2]|nr:MAG: hypothetical protein FRX49_03302 [Trebouxia sp. A1-2]